MTNINRTNSSFKRLTLPSLDVCWRGGQPYMILSPENASPGTLMVFSAVQLTSDLTSGAVSCRDWYNFLSRTL